ncbi:hypothetical protein L3Q82_013740 [Scortum barcoo]|uniref:Uncharacterized protein n=1 Tax=Scortum barcoo TaxID=214431 RepID=A0ACB8W1R5_9TELE|nr:hypothetical protein L3Q82_013740 [Scortum barcoo]
MFSASIVSTLAVRSCGRKVSGACLGGNPQNPVVDTRKEEAEAGDSEVDSSITQAEVTEVVRKLLKAGNAEPGADEISCMEVGDSTSGVANRGGGPFFKKGDRRVCSNYRGITLLSLPGKVYAI